MAEPVEPPPPACLQTADLLLHPTGLDDARELHALWNEPSLRRELWDGRGLSEEQSCELIRQSLARQLDSGLGLWTARTGEGELVGFCGFPPFGSPGEIELIYGVAPAQRLRGYARQMAAAVVGYGFTVAGLAQVRAATGPQNTASQRVLQRLGFVAEPRPSPAGKRVFVRRAARDRDHDAAWEAA